MANGTTQSIPASNVSCKVYLFTLPKVSKPMVRTQYGVDCGMVRAYVPASGMRAPAASAEDKRVEAETAAALARQPRPGPSLGAKYGTREPVTCANRTAPAKGAPSPEQVRASSFS